MDTKLQIQNFCAAKWTENYLAENGTLGNKTSWCSRLIRMLSNVPFIGQLFPKNNVIIGLAAIKQAMTDLKADPNVADMLKNAAKKADELAQYVLVKRAKADPDLQELMQQIKALVPTVSEKPVEKPPQEDNPQPPVPPQQPVEEAPSTPILPPAATSPQETQPSEPVRLGEDLVDLNVIFAPDEEVKEKPAEVKTRPASKKKRMDEERRPAPTKNPAKTSGKTPRVPSKIRKTN